MGHIVVGGAFSLAAGNVVPVTSASTALLAALVGSLLPDIDHPKSTLGRYNPVVGLMKHRGHTHSLIGIFILATPFLGLSNEAYLFGVIGGFSHLIADKMYSWLPGHKEFRLKIW